MKRIGIHQRLALGHSRKLLQGIREEVSESNLPWTLLLETRKTMDLPESVDGWIIDGMSFETVVTQRESAVPVIVTSPKDHPLPTHCVSVTNDNHQIGVQAAEHLFGLGYRNFTYIHNNPERIYGRGRAFLEKTEQLGGTAFAGFEYRAEGAPAKDLKKWLQGLALPCAVFAFNDNLAWMLLEHCRDAGLHVPSDIALLGCDNDEDLCLTAFPPLSSVVPNALEVGRQSVTLLHRLLEDPGLSPENVLIPPIGILQRQSTERVSEDQLISQVLSYLDQHYREPLQTEDIAAHCGIAPRTLYQRFNTSYEMTLNQALTSIRIQKAKRLLCDTQHPVIRIAALCGFSSDQYFSRTFRTTCGMTPITYRKTFTGQA
jgi:LacI family transcriptional regulator